MILNIIVAALGEEVGDLSPAVSDGSVAFDEQFFLVFSVLKARDLWIQVHIPLLFALLGQPG